MANTEDSKFLPSFCRPTHYELQLVPDLDKRKFYGEVWITVDLRKATKQIKMHQKNLEINHETTIKHGEKSWQVTGTQDDNKTETVLFKFPDEIPKCDGAVIHVKFTGDLKKDMMGLYRTTYFDLKGKRHTTIATHFEPTGARRCFPCFDEPKSKATFSVRVVMEARFHVLSNMPPDTEDNIMPNVYPPMREWRFQKTPLMSTYLLGITAGEWDRVEAKTKNGTVVRAWSRLGRVHEVEGACEWTAKCVDFFDDYFQCPFPLPKLDVVPVENFAAGAMENWGVILFKNQYLVHDQGTDAKLSMDIKEVVAHEVAHMWFGNLVTPRYWDALWLKEGFATYFSYVVCKALEPSVEWKSLLLVDQTARGKQADSMSSTHALESTVTSGGEMHEIYDEVSYYKGCALIHFVESYMGADALREGLQNYIKQFQFKNAASLDLWLALGKVAPNKEGPALKDVMKDWVKQEGFPHVKVERPSPNQLKLTQKRFTANSSTQKWIIPIHITTSVKPGAPEMVFIDADTKTVEIDPKATWVVVNADQRAFVTVQYEGKELVDALTSNFSSLPTADRTGILVDLVELFKQKRASAGQFFSFLSAIAPKETAPLTWRVIFEALQWCLTIWDEDVQAKQQLQKYVRNLVNHLWKSWGLTPKDNEDASTRIAHGDLIELLAMADEKEVLLAAQELLEAKGPMGVPVDVRGAVWKAVIIKGHRPTHDALIKIIETSQIDSDVKRAIHAVQQSRNAADIGKHFQLLLPVSEEKGSRVKGQFLTEMCRGLDYSNGAARKSGWSFISNHWSELQDAADGEMSGPTLLKAMKNASDDGTARQVKDFVARQSAAVKSAVGKTVEQVAEEVRRNAQLRVASAQAIKTLQ